MNIFMRRWGDAETEDANGNDDVCQYTQCIAIYIVVVDAIASFVY